MTPTPIIVTETRELDADGDYREFAGECSHLCESATNKACGTAIVAGVKISKYRVTVTVEVLP